jgi:hypothetical protein
MFGNYSFWLAVAAILVVLIGLQYTFNWFLRGTGMATIWLLSLGKVRLGVRRDLWKLPPRAGRGSIFLFVVLLVVGLAYGYVRHDG